VVYFEGKIGYLLSFLLCCVYVTSKRWQEDLLRIYIALWWIHMFLVQRDSSLFCEGIGLVNGKGGGRGGGGGGER